MARVAKSTEEETETPEISKEQRIAKLTKDINARWTKKGVINADRPIVGTLATMSALRGEKIPTGNLNLDLKLGGGLTRGTSVLAWGASGVGKSMSAMETMAGVIKRGGVGLWIQTDPGDVAGMAALFGIEPDNPRFLHQDVMGSGEMTFEILHDFLTSDNKPSNLIDYVVVDSVAGLAPKEELEAIGKDGLGSSSQGMALPERMMSRLFRIMHSTKMYDQAAVVFISEARVDMSSYGTPMKPKGGNATMHGVRLNLRYTAIGGKDGLLKVGTGDKERVVGHRYRIKFIKDGIRHRNQHYEFENDVYYGKGLDNNIALFQLLMEDGGFLQSAASYTANTSMQTYITPDCWKFRGQENFKEALRTNEAFQKGCLEYLTALYSGKNLVEENITESTDEEADNYIEEQVLEAEVLLLEDVE